MARTDDEESRLRRAVARGAGLEEIKRLLEVVRARQRPAGRRDPICVRTTVELQILSSQDAPESERPIMVAWRQLMGEAVGAGQCVSIRVTDDAQVATCPGCNQQIEVSRDISASEDVTECGGAHAGVCAEAAYAFDRAAGRAPEWDSDDIAPPDDVACEAIRRAHHIAAYLAGVNSVWREGGGRASVERHLDLEARRLREYEGHGARASRAAAERREAIEIVRREWNRYVAPDAEGH